MNIKKKYLTRVNIMSVSLAVMILGISSSLQTMASQTREIGISTVNAAPGQAFTLPIELVSLGDENKVAFSVSYDPAIVVSLSVALGSGASGATLDMDTTQASTGKLGITLTQASGNVFAGGILQLVVISASVAADAPLGSSNVTFDDQPVPRAILNASGMTLTSIYTPGFVNVVQANPIPTLTSLSPASIAAGNGQFTLVVNGTNFVRGATVQWNGDPRSTNFVNSTRVTAAISAGDVATPGTATITVTNPAPGGGTSNSKTFTIDGSGVTISSISPNTANAGSPDVVMTVNGSGFVSGSKVKFNITELATTFSSATKLTATIPATSLTTAGMASVTVVNPDATTSPSVTFTIGTGPTITTLSPTSAVVGGAAFMLTVNGVGFVSDSTVQWNGSNRTTTFSSATKLTAAIPATDLTTASTASVTVVNPAPDGGTSNTISFPITSPSQTPTITSLSPRFAVAGKPAFMLTVNGTNFTNISTVKLNDADLTTTFVSATQLKAEISATSIATAGTANIKVGTSTTVAFPIANGLFTGVSAGSYLGELLAPESIVAGFGPNLATREQRATSQPLPTDLASTKVTVIDNLGASRLAPLFYVNTGQVNFQVPKETAVGEALVTVTSGDGKTAAGTMMVASIAPSIFTANANGSGVPAASGLRVKPDNSRTDEVVFRLDSTTQKFVTTPLDLGDANDKFFLILYGTGFRNRSSLSAVSVTIGGTNAQVDFAGAAPELTGVEQGNILIPRSLMGRGEVDLVMTVDGKKANTVKLNIK